VANATAQFESGRRPVATTAANAGPRSGIQRAGRTAESADTETRIYLARHGRTALNAAGVLRGRLDPELDVVGLKQAMALGDVIGRQKLQLVVSSPLKRAVDTATQVATRAGLEVEIDERLIDRDYGPWAGKSRGEVIARWGSLNAAPEIESEADVFTRAMDALIDVSRRVPGGVAVMVSHDAVNRLLLLALDSTFDDVDELPQDTGCFNVIEHRDGQWSVKSINNIPPGLEGAPIPPTDAEVQTQPDSEKT
jgi:broad specificity phosphatase PhoE